MKHFKFFTGGMFVMAIMCCISSQHVHAQTDVDGVTLKKNIFCVGVVYSQNTWSEYWQGTRKRDNLNNGTVTTRMYNLMGNYGITNKLNFLFSVPYVKTKATEGTLKGLEGIQYLSLMLKYTAFVKEFSAKDRLTIFGVGKISFPLSNYAADYQPLSIGMHSKTAGIRAIVDYKHGNFFATASGAYTYRSNIEIDRTAYYTTEMHYTNEVKMPDMAGFNFGAGYRDKRWALEAVYEVMKTLGGFDIRINDGPFPSNEMNASQVGANIKYTMHKVKGLEFTGGGRYVVSGRNMGQATTFYGGVFYLMDLAGKRKTKTNINN